MVDLNEDLVIYRVKGKWHWHSKRGLSKSEVISLLEAHAERMHLKQDLILEALKHLSDEV